MPTFSSLKNGTLNIFYKIGHHHLTSENDRIIDKRDPTLPYPYCGNDFEPSYRASVLIGTIDVSLISYVAIDGIITYGNDILHVLH